MTDATLIAAQVLVARSSILALTSVLRGKGLMTEAEEKGILTVLSSSFQNEADRMGGEGAVLLRHLAAQIEGFVQGEPQAPPA